MASRAQKSTIDVDARNRWLILAMFSCAYGLAYLDRQVFTILVDPIRRHLDLNDTQIGLVQGAAFSVSFALGGVPMGWMVDNANRMRVTAGCVAIWTAATSCTGLAATYAQIVTARSVTALGEAGCSPAALSVFADIFHARELPRATAIYMTAPYLGGSIALFAGGWALNFFEQAGGETLPLIGHIEPWQAVFVALGAPGLLLAACFCFFGREPARIGTGNGDDAPISMREVVRFFAREARYLQGYFCAYACVLAMLFALVSWFPTLAMRSGFGTAAELGRPLGLAFLCCGIMGTLAAQWLVGRVHDIDVVPRVMRLATWLISIQAALAVALWLGSSFSAAFACYALMILTTSILISVMPIPLQVGIPNRMRGRIVGFFMLSVNVVGSGLGTALVGLISDALGSTAGALSVALACVFLACSIAGVVFMRSAEKRFRAACPAQVIPSFQSVVDEPA
jgi:MFS family permease